MRNSGIYLVVAIGVGLAVAASALYILKPQDTPVTLPGTQTLELPAELLPAASAPAPVPPVILRVGPANGKLIHVVLGGLEEADKDAYQAARALQQSNPDLTLNIVPAMDAGNASRLAFAWAMAANGQPEQQEAFIDSLMASSGRINSSVLTLLAQNSGLDAARLAEQAAKPETEQALAQANNVLPPSLPAIFVNGEWLTGSAVNGTTLGRELGQSASQFQNTRLVVTGAHAFATAPTAKMGAIFMTVRNMGGEPARIVGAVTPVAGTVEIHENTLVDGKMTMRAKPEVEIAAGATQVFAHDGLHLMLMDLPAPLAVGQKFPLTLILQGGSEISTFVTVTKPGEVLTNHHH